MLPALLPLNEEIEFIIPGVAKFNDTDGHPVTTSLKSMSIRDAVTFAEFVKGDNVYNSVGTLLFHNTDEDLVGKIVPIEFVLKGLNSYGYDELSTIKLNVFLTEPLNNTDIVIEDPRNDTILVEVKSMSK